ncbi:hypothetical protein HYC85_021465 [Camellia sinensis]|uniref:Uncharacterized protein n=1 Tax=Camellia sinensis TaxID=4442 RepID=A0A7J7GLQ7_CAMSI|nr:hypothetical protein HYC85_021465 [Camellia sinensis]
MYIYIYIYIERELRKEGFRSQKEAKASLRSKACREKSSQGLIVSNLKPFQSPFLDLPNCITQNLPELLSMASLPPPPKPANPIAEAARKTPQLPKLNLHRNRNEPEKPSPRTAQLKQMEP